MPISYLGQRLSLKVIKVSYLHMLLRSKVIPICYYGQMLSLYVIKVKVYPNMFIRIKFLSPCVIKARGYPCMLLLTY